MQACLYVHLCCEEHPRRDHVEESRSLKEKVYLCWHASASLYVEIQNQQEEMAASEESQLSKCVNPADTEGLLPVAETQT